LKKPNTAGIKDQIEKLEKELPFQRCYFKIYKSFLDKAHAASGENGVSLEQLC